ncbi:MAG: transketolase family protein [Planctomycetaceae bacterium]
MRNAFARELADVAADDPRVVLLSGDIGNRLFNDYKARFGDRFFNCGVAEANMIGVAAGMAMCGLRPIAYTIVPFITTRCLEQIRVDLCYHRVPVILVGVGGGLCYAGLGATHHACEDIALLRSFPEMTVICPGDPIEVRLALRQAVHWDGPVYIRIGKKGEPAIHAQEPPFVIGQAITLHEGSDVTLISTGNILPVAVQARQLLCASGASTRLVDMHTVKPLDERCLEVAFASSGVVATIEEHSLIGGLGGAVAEWLSERPASRARLVRFGTPDRFLHDTADQQQARMLFGLTPETIADRIRDVASQPQTAGRTDL